MPESEDYRKSNTQDIGLWIYVNVGWILKTAVKKKGEHFPIHIRMNIIQISFSILEDLQVEWYSTQFSLMENIPECFYISFMFINSFSTHFIFKLLYEGKVF